MPGRKLRSLQIERIFLRLAQLDDGLAILKLGIAAHFLDQFLVYKGLVDETKVLSVRILEGRGLLVGDALRLFVHVDPRHKAEIGGIAFTCRAVEFIDHTAGQATDSDFSSARSRVRS